MMALSLKQRVWLTVIAAMTPVMIGVAALSTWHSKTHLETQISIQNADAAEALASALSSITGAGAELEQKVNKQFDLSHYQLIRIEDGAGNVIYQRQRPMASNAPGAQTDWLSLNIAPGQALILGEWSSLKRVVVESDPSFATQSFMGQYCSNFYFLFRIRHHFGARRYCPVKDPDACFATFGRTCRSDC
jgi:hypothetical protein